jgi:hypothetical protein
MIPSSLASLISARFAVSIKNFIKILLLQYFTCSGPGFDRADVRLIASEQALAGEDSDS